jgi:NADH-quinone oxidoreductase subunit N
MSLIYGAWGKGFDWLILCLVINSVISLFYYLRVAKHLFLQAPSEKTAAPQPALAYFMAGLAAVTIVFGLWATPLIEWTSSSMDLLASR